MMKITFFDEQNFKIFNDDMRNAVQKVIEAAGKSEGIEGSINLLITNDEGIKKLNAEFRDKNTPTDVLSFPAYSFNGLLKDNLNDIEWEFEDGSKFLGDLAISLERAYAQAEEYGHSAVREVSFLALHGTLHLLGYDHMMDDDEMIMTERQNKILADMGILRG